MRLAMGLIAMGLGLAACGTLVGSDDEPDAVPVAATDAGDGASTGVDSGTDAGGPATDAGYCDGYTYCDRFEGPNIAPFWAPSLPSGGAASIVNDPVHGSVLEVTRPEDAGGDAVLQIKNIAAPPSDIELWFSVVSPPTGGRFVSVFDLGCGGAYAEVNVDAVGAEYKSGAPEVQAGLGGGARRVAVHFEKGLATIVTDGHDPIQRAIPSTLQGTCFLYVGVIGFDGASATVHIDDFRAR